MIFNIYKRQKYLFQKEEIKAALSIYQIQPNKIEIELGKKLISGSIYVFPKKKLEIFGKYLKQNLKKGFIRKSQSIAKQLVFL